MDIDHGLAALAVDKALTKYQRDVFMRRLVGPWQSAQPADYIEGALGADTHLIETEPWWEQNGQWASEIVTGWIDVAEQDAARVLSCALIAVIVTHPEGAKTPAMETVARLEGSLAAVFDDVVRLAERALFWLTGYNYSSETLRQGLR